MYKLTKFMNTADRGGAGGTGGQDLSSVLAGLAETVKALAAKVDGMPAAMTEAASKAVNGALTKRERAAKEAAEAAAKKAEEAGDEVDEEEAIATAAKPASGQPASAGAGAVDPLVARAQREAKRAIEQVKKLQEQMAAKEAQAAKERADLQAREDRTALHAALAPKVRPELLDTAVAYLSSRLARPEGATAAVWREGDDELTMAEGIDRWLSTPSGKAHLPPVQGQGAGGKAGQVDKNGQKVFTDGDLGGLLNSRF